jgi:hypothetical protein
MVRFTIGNWRRWFLSVALTLTFLLLPGTAGAFGRIDWGPKTIKPRADGNSWNIDIKIFMGKAPNVPTVQMKFEFDQKVYYERAMVDGDKLVTRNVPIEGKQPVVETADVGFLDPATSRIENRTRFTFKLHRDHGFDCGEYRVTVRDTRNGQLVGTPVNLILGGENEVIDRRSIVFSGEKKKEKKKEKTEDAGAPDSASDSAKKKSEPATDALPANEVPPADETPGDSAETIKKKPGGCGCRIQGRTPMRSAQGSLLLFVAGLAIAGRRRGIRRVYDEAR